MSNKHTKTIKDLKKVMLSTPESRLAFDEAERAWRLKELLITAREHANLTPSELAKKLDLAPSNINRIENNPDKANIQTIFKYLDACNAKINFNLEYQV